MLNQHYSDAIEDHLKNLYFNLVLNETHLFRLANMEKKVLPVDWSKKTDNEKEKWMDGKVKGLETLVKSIKSDIAALNLYKKSLLKK